MPREGRASSTPRLLGSITDATEYSSRAMTARGARNCLPTVIASGAKQSRLPPRKDSGLLRCARNDEMRSRGSPTQKCASGKRVADSHESIRAGTNIAFSW
ncbi:hypothetical protein BJS_02854 [Bradyrhizobium japonicum SEMIA 5079]|nr:hypothetical protein BJS_02854 [Bradyrhizobium japonicum SEMIA 5079]